MPDNSPGFFDFLFGKKKLKEASGESNTNSDNSKKIIPAFDMKANADDYMKTKQVSPITNSTGAPADVNEVKKKKPNGTVQ